MVQIRRVRKYRMYDKYREDVWGWLAYSRTRGYLKLLLKHLYRKRLLFGYNWKKKIDYSRIGKRRRGFGRRRSLFKKELHEKQKIQFFYHIVREYQLKRFYKRVKGTRGILEDNFVGILESRVLSILYRVGLVNSMRVGSQLVTHHGVMVEGRRIKKYNHVLVPGQMIELTKEDTERFKKVRGVYDKRSLLGKSPSRRDNRKANRGRKAADFPFHRDLLFNMKRKRSTFLRKGELYYIKIKNPRAVKQGWVPPPRLRKRVPDYLEVSYKLGKVMLVYRPKAKEVYYPFKTSLKEVASYLSR